MDLITDTFIIFSCLMFWIIFHNKKGLLSEIKKTEKLINEKIVVLEDLIDKHNFVLKKINENGLETKSVPTQVDPLQFDLFSSIPQFETPPINTSISRFSNPTTDINNLDLATNSLNIEEVPLSVLPAIDENFHIEAETELVSEKGTKSKILSNTEYRVLGLSEELLDDAVITNENTHSNPKANAENVTNEQVNKESSISDESYSMGVHNMILEAKENLLKIDVSNVQELRTFKDVVLMAKKIEMEKNYFKNK